MGMLRTLYLVWIAGLLLLYLSISGELALVLLKEGKIRRRAAYCRWDVIAMTLVSIFEQYSMNTTLVGDSL